MIFFLTAFAGFLALLVTFHAHQHQLGYVHQMSIEAANSSLLKWKDMDSYYFTTRLQLSNEYVPWHACKHYNPSLYERDLKSCFDNAVVPGTVLSTLLKQNVFTDENGTYITDSNIFFESNLAQIPDINETSSEYYTFWFVADLSTLLFQTAKDKMSRAKRVQLLFRGINYRASIFLQLANDNTSHYQTIQLSSTNDTSGMFVTRTYDVTSAFVDNYSNTTGARIALFVQPPDFVGNCTSGQGGDHEIARNGAINQFACGWDWIQATPDRNTGIWDKIELIVSNKNVVLSLPYVRSTNINVQSETASLEGSVTVNCPIAPKKQKCSGSVVMRVLKTRYNYNNNNNQPDYVVVASATTNIDFSEDTTSEKIVFFPPIDLQNVSFWYPFTHGSPYLYQIEMMFLPTSTTIESHLTSGIDISFAYGIRKVEHYMEINDVPVFITGGNWIATDQLFRYSKGDRASVDRYYDEVRMHRDMGMNMIRVWGGSIAERNEFYDACDQLGLLVYQEFWMTGDNNGRWAGSYNWPDNYTSYLENSKSVILMNRNHPSLIMYVGGNELSPDNLNPPPTIANGLLNLIHAYDAGRYYIPSSMSPQKPDPKLFNASYALAPQDGPYGILLPSNWYERNPGLENYSHTPISFQPEVGSVSTPTYASLRQFLSAESLAAFPVNSSSTIYPSWDYHKYISYTTEYTDPVTNTKRVYNQIDAYGVPDNIEEYALRAQLVQYEQYRTLFEGYQVHQWIYYAAVLMWKSQSPWPVLRGALYDYYQEQTGGYFGVQAALRPYNQNERVLYGLHVQLNPKTLAISIINKLSKCYDDVTVVAAVFQLDGTQLYQKPFGDNNIGPNKVMTLRKSLPWMGDSVTNVLIYRLRLLSNAKGIAKENTYWLSDPSLPEPNYLPLGILRANRAGWLDIIANAKCKHSNQISGIRQSASVKLTITNPTEKLAFGVVVSVKRYDTQGNLDNRVLPSFYLDNYIILTPNESKTIHIEYRITGSLINSTFLSVSGWNIFSFDIPLSCDSML